MSNIQLFLALANATVETGYVSRWVHRNEFVGEYATLHFGNGGSWCRMDTSRIARDYKMVTVKGSRMCCFSWEPLEDEKKTIEDSVPDMSGDRGNSIVYIKLFGEKVALSSASRLIRSDIRMYYSHQPCVVCGTSAVEVDHKNGLYNDPRVMTIATQTMADFQALCKHCNDKKRETMKVTKATGIRHSALSIPQLVSLGVAYTTGGEGYDPMDPNAMVGTYWYDPVDFIEKVVKAMR